MCEHVFHFSFNLWNTGVKILQFKLSEFRNADPGILIVRFWNTGDCFKILEFWNNWNNNSKSQNSRTLASNSNLTTPQFFLSEL